MSGHQVAEQPMTEPTDLESRVRPVSVGARARHASGAPERVDVASRLVAEMESG